MPALGGPPSIRCVGLSKLAPKTSRFARVPPSPERTASGHSLAAAAPFRGELAGTRGSGSSRGASARSPPSLTQRG
eukprot:8389173-Alexandrium_andersonii.AAC.1